MNGGFAGDTLLELVLRDEDRDMWRIYLDRNDYANAFRRCRNQVWALDRKSCHLRAVPATVTG